MCSYMYKKTRYTTQQSLQYMYNSVSFPRLFLSQYFSRYSFYCVPFNDSYRIHKKLFLGFQIRKGGIRRKIRVCYVDMKRMVFTIMLYGVLYTT